MTQSATANVGDTSHRPHCSRLPRRTQDLLADYKARGNSWGPVPTDAMARLDSMQCAREVQRIRNVEAAWRRDATRGERRTRRIMWAAVVVLALAVLAWWA